MKQLNFGGLLLWTTLYCYWKTSTGLSHKSPKWPRIVLAIATRVDSTRRQTLSKWTTYRFCPLRLSAEKRLYRSEKFRYNSACTWFNIDRYFLQFFTLTHSISITRSSATAEKQRVSCAYLPHLGWLTDRAMHRTPQNRRGCTISDIQTLWFKKCWPKTHFVMK